MKISMSAPAKDNPAKNKSAPARKTGMEIALMEHENAQMKKEIARLQRVKTGWMIAAIVSFALFAIVLAMLFV